MLRLECRVAAGVKLEAASGTWNPSCVAEAAYENMHSRSIAEYRAGENIARSASQRAIFSTPQNGQSLAS